VPMVMMTSAPTIMVAAPPHVTMSVTSMRQDDRTVGAIDQGVVARGIAEADSVGIATSAQAATPTSNNRFIWEGLLGGPL
jgi:hypothetical protein